MTETEPREFASCALPILSHCLESYVLGEHQPLKFMGALEQLIIWEFGVSVLNCREDIRVAPAQLVGDGLRDMYVHV